MLAKVFSGVCCLIIVVVVVGCGENCEPFKPETYGNYVDYMFRPGEIIWIQGVRIKYIGPVNMTGVHGNPRGLIEINNELYLLESYRWQFIEKIYMLPSIVTSGPCAGALSIRVENIEIGLSLSLLIFKNFC